MGDQIPLPQELVSPQDLLNKFGSWDETIGDFGGSGGNLYAALRNKKFSRLIIAPVNLASAKGARVFRELPLCRSQADSNPIVPMQGASAAAGREFRNGSARVRLAKRVDFTGLDAIKRDLAGNVIAGASAATQVFSSGKAFGQVWQYDDSATTFVDQTANANSVTAADWIIFPASEAVLDYAAFGFVGSTFEKLTFNNAGGTVGVGGVVAWEYWNGSAWTALTVVDGTSGFTAAAAAGQTVTWTAPSDWATLALNAITAYYVRARVTTVYSTNPVYDRGFVAGVDWTTVARPDGTLGAHKGDVLVVGYNSSGAKAPTLEAGTYRVASETSSGINLTVERLDGASFAWTASANVPWRLHYASDADSAPVLVPGSSSPIGYGAGDAGGYVVPIRPLTNSTGGAVDGTYSSGTLLTPMDVPAALTGDSWDTLSALGARTFVGATTAFTAAVQGINPVVAAGLEALYSTAIDSLRSEAAPVRDVNIVVAARTSTTIRAKLKQHVLDSSSRGRGRVTVISPDLAQQSTSAAVADATPGVGATRAERVIYSWPGERTFIPEAVNYRLKTADSNTTIDGILDLRADFRLASILSNLAPERNPGQAEDPVATIMSTVLGIQRGVTDLQIEDYILLKSAGVCALRIDRTSGAIFQSGVTSSLTSGQKNINRRRMADYIEDSLAERLVQFSKLPMSNQLKDGSVGETIAFLDELLSPNNSAAARINAYQVDDKAGNTPEAEAKGIFVIITRVRTTPTADVIVVQAEIGENVVITSSL